eukprot:1159531-Pelagomonas_calceolata.AAC.3
MLDGLAEVGAEAPPQLCPDLPARPPAGRQACMGVRKGNGVTPTDQFLICKPLGSSICDGRHHSGMAWQCLHGCYADCRASHVAHMLLAKQSFWLKTCGKCIEHRLIRNTKTNMEVFDLIALLLPMLARLPHKNA